MAPRRSVLVNGTPKTGTTWMAMLLCSLPGYRSAGNFQGEIDGYRSVGSGQIIHGHDCFTPELAKILAQQGIGVVVMLRDPRDQVVSRMYHIRRDRSHRWRERLTAMDDDQALMTLIEGRPGLENVREQYEISLSWLVSDVDVCCVRYEDLASDPVPVFTRVLHHLGIEASPDQVAESVRRNRFARLTAGRRFWHRGRQPGEEDVSSHFRKGITGDWRNHFLPAHVQRFDEIAHDLLVGLGYEQEGQAWA